ncbi:MAG: MerC family mercury resistance protein [Myxococcota bacterium]|nr:MerC family mercury resistance protein [Myxococcota bacterium]
MSQKIDRFGAVASSLCAVHCAAVALLPLAFGALGLSFLAGHTAEWGFTIVAIVFALFALNMSWRKNRSVPVTALLMIGIVGLLASRFIEMSSGDHGHHGHQEHVAETHHKPSEHDSEHHEPAAKKNAKEHDKHKEEHNSEHRAHSGHDGHGDHEGIGHVVGTVVGVLAGLLLFLGHLLNLRATRRREACCE